MCSTANTPLGIPCAGLYSYSTTNSVDRDGKGLDRYRAPSRNYAVSLEWKF